MKILSRMKLRYLKNRLNNIPIDRLYFHPREKYIWVSNPKCASTSIIQNFAPETPLQSMNKTRDWAFNEYGLFKYSIQEIRQIINEFPSFCIVRNPYLRLVSAYKNKIERQQKKTQFWRTKEKRQILQELKLSPKNLNAHVPFSSFVEAILRIPKDKLDPHFSPQTSILKLGEFKYSEIIHFENLQFELNSFCHNNQVKIKLPKKFYKKTEHGRANFLICEDLMSGIQELYSDDFKHLHYDKFDLPNSLSVE